MDLLSPTRCRKLIFLEGPAKVRTLYVAARDPRGGPPKGRCRLLRAVVERTRVLTFNYVRVILAAVPGLRPGSSKQFVRQAAPTACKRQHRECFHIRLAGWHGLQSTTTTRRLGGRNGVEMLCVIEVKWHETFGMVEYVDLKVAKAASCGHKLVNVWQMRPRMCTALVPYEVPVGAAPTSRE